MVAILFCLFPKKSFGLFGSPTQRAPFRVVAQACSEWERSNQATALIFAKQIQHKRQLRRSRGEVLLAKRHKNEEKSNKMRFFNKIDLLLQLAASLNSYFYRLFAVWTFFTSPTYFYLLTITNLSNKNPSSLSFAPPKECPSAFTRSHTSASSKGNTSVSALICITSP